MARKGMSALPREDAIGEAEGEMKIILQPIGWVLMACLLLGAQCAGAADFSAWGKRLPITFSGYPAAREALTNFPTLVVLTDGSNGVSFADFKSAGADLRFTDASQGNELSYEIDTWNDAAGKSYVWVQVPMLTNNAVIHAF